MVSLLWTLEISVYNLILMEVVHASGNLLGPVNQFLWRNLLAFSQQVEQWSVRAILHHYAIDRSLGTHTPGRLSFRTEEKNHFLT